VQQPSWAGAWAPWTGLRALRQRPPGLLPDLRRRSGIVSEFLHPVNRIHAPPSCPQDGAIAVRDALMEPCPNRHPVKLSARMLVHEKQAASLDFDAFQPTIRRARTSITNAAYTTLERRDVSREPRQISAASQIPAPSSSG